MEKGWKRRAGLGFEACGYAAFLQNAGFFCRGDSQGLHPGLVCDAPLGHGIRNTVDGPGIGTADRVWYRKRGRGMESGTR